MEGFVYGKTQSEAIERSLALLKAHTLIDPGSCFIELGCGYGRDVISIASELRGSVYGVDVSGQAMVGANNLLNERHNHHTTPIFVKADALEFLTREDILGFTACHVYTHYFLQVLPAEYRNALFECANDRLPKGSLFILSEYSASDQRFGKGIEVDSGTFILYPDKPEHKIHFFSEREIDSISSQFGWDVIHKVEYTELEEVKNSLIRSCTWLVMFRIS
ncbi:MAG: methyltransferase domain-containing protein [Acidobacteria bacterium]|nr:methyltransferase domain-containing protein [Acidobacteriota bacterium]